MSAHGLLAQSARNGRRGRRTEGVIAGLAGCGARSMILRRASGTRTGITMVCS